MKKYLFLACFILSPAWCMDYERICREQGEKIGDGEGHSTISQECIDFAKSLSNSSQKYRAPDGNLEIIGYLNYIIIEKNFRTDPKLPPPSREILAGTMTKIEEVKSLTFDKAKNEITVVDSISGQTLVFSLKVVGNIAPHSIVEPAPRLP